MGRNDCTIAAESGASRLCGLRNVHDEELLVTADAEPSWMCFQTAVTTVHVRVTYSEIAGCR